MDAATAHVVNVDRRRNFTSATMPADALKRLEGVFRSAPWYSDRWSHKAFRAAATAMLRGDAAGGLVLIGPGFSAAAPPPFAELFEPIEMSGFGGDVERLKTLSGEAPTKQEWVNRFVVAIFGIAGVFVASGLLVGFMRGMSTRVLPILGGIVLIVAATVCLVIFLLRLGGRWFLVPGGVAIVGGWHKRRRGVMLVTRTEACAVLRYVSTGKSVALILELIARNGRRHHRAVSDREAVSFLAAWRSPHPPPTLAQLQELASTA